MSVDIEQWDAMTARAGVVAGQLAQLNADLVDLAADLRSAVASPSTCCRR
ncbi:hypothetical protein LKO27_05605 [Tessaracoccus sp. OS52]|nr:hypothetical protein [Tessaracoccus sp. OS52]MCC2592888.1 hypothetical protein [Tessaracoccus sp. OS52]